MSAELQEHLQIVRQRLVDRGLSTLELKQEITSLRQELIDQLPGSDPEVVTATMEMVGDMIAERAVQPQLTPEELLTQTEQTNPAAHGALAWQMERNTLQAAVDAAQAVVDENNRNGTTNQIAIDKLAQAEAKLTDQGAPPFAQDLQAARDFRNTAEQLQQRTALATTDEERDAIAAESEAFFAKATALETNRPPPPAPIIPDQPPSPPDHVAAAEAAVANAMASEG